MLDRRSSRWGHEERLYLRSQCLGRSSGPAHPVGQQPGVVAAETGTETMGTETETAVATVVTAAEMGTETTGTETETAVATVVTAAAMGTETMGTETETAGATDFVEQADYCRHWEAYPLLHT